LDWKPIQDFYDLGHSWREIKNKFNISFNEIAKAQKAGLFKSRTWLESYLRNNPNRIGKKQTTETKLKLSIARKKYLSEHPETCSWKTHNKFKSIPCELIKNYLLLLNIKFESEYQPLLHDKRFFSLDIAFPEYKIAFEINGGQHYENGQLKPYYQQRHDLIVKDGWILYEIPYLLAMRKDFVQTHILPLMQYNLNSVFIQ